MAAKIVPITELSFLLANIGVGTGGIEPPYTGLQPVAVSISAKRPYVPYIHKVENHPHQLQKGYYNSVAFLPHLCRYGYMDKVLLLYSYCARGRI